MKRLLLLLALVSAQLPAQCVMCFRTAAAQQEQRARVLNAGIVLLGAPPFAILAGFCYLAYRRNSSYRSPDENPDDRP
jgi:ABC-type amino acid transport substrate-binding protein